ncbi:MAG: DUF6774 domain-containing protein [Lachnospiraceae bacterium]
MNNCTNLYLLSTIACQLSECLDKDDLAVLAADLVVLSDMLANILARQAACPEENSSKEVCPTDINSEENCQETPYTEDSCPENDNSENTCQDAPASYGQTAVE